MSQVTWWEVENMKGRKKVAKWLRTCGIDTDGVVYVPAAIGGCEELVYLSAMFDGARMAMDGPHAYVDSRWMAKEFPALADAFSKIERNAAGWPAP